MRLEFFKYQGTGNDFILLNGLETPDAYSLTKEQVAALCDRRFGIGADGLIILASSDVADFKMIYFNSDGGESTMCGNGGRCIAQFAYDQKIVNTTMVFEAIDGMHKAQIADNQEVELQMIDVNEYDEVDSETFIMNTGSPHFVKFSDNFENIDIVSFGRQIRYSDEFSDEGINVNLSTLENDVLHVKTYERGVEDETYSCGTGVTAAALCATRFLHDDMKEIDVLSKGGQLRVKFEKQGRAFMNVWLCGPALFVYKGHINLSI